MALPSLNPDDQSKFATVVTEGVQYMHEIDDLKQRIKESAAALAEDFGVKPAQIIAAIRTKFKDSLADQKENMMAIEEILQASGNG
jgi:hypothetical protein